MVNIVNGLAKVARDLENKRPVTRRSKKGECALTPWNGQKLGKYLTPHVNVHQRAEEGPKIRRTTCPSLWMSLSLFSPSPLPSAGGDVSNAWTQQPMLPFTRVVPLLWLLHAGSATNRCQRLVPNMAPSPKGSTIHLVACSLWGLSFDHEGSSCPRTNRQVVWVTNPDYQG